uniref:Uncharacterized protein n=1 Tax=Globodera rostochiensis TaxID=31243 RepID=A0A914HHP0_GLORO
MLRCSRSEFGAADLMPEAVELGMRVRLRQLRFGQPEEYAQLEQVEVHKFLSSKSVHNWLSEWNLSRTFSAPNRGRNALDLLDLDCCRRRKADFCVQCTGEEIDLALGHLSTAAEAAFASPTPAGATGGYSNTFQSYSNPATTAWHFTNNITNNNHNGSLLNRPRTFHPPSLMNASTNTQTTETTRTSGGTGGRMHVFRRASLLEEYAQKTLRKLEEKEEGEKQKRGRQETAGRRRAWTGGCWASKCCGRRGTDSGDDENDTYSSEPMVTNERRTKFSPASIASSSHTEQSHRTNIVKRFTLTRTSGGGEESSTPRTAADYAPLPKTYCFNACGEWTHGKAATNGWGRDGGNYDNVPEAWRRRPGEDGMGGDRRNCDRSFFI